MNSGVWEDCGLRPLPPLCSPQDPQSSWHPPRTARSMPPRISPWPAGPRRTLPTSPTAGSRTASTSSTLGGALRDGAGTGWGQVLGSLLAEPGLDSSPHVPHCSRLQSRVRILVDGSLWLQAAQPDDAGRYTCVPSNGLPHPPSASAYLTVLCKPGPCSPHSLLPPLGQAPRLLHHLPLFPPRPSPGDSDAS